jgi:metal-sulfur cluster biosynthetic enzyme
MELLREVHDPEIPINIVDLGLVYDLEVHKRGDGQLVAVVRMTLTAPGCGMGDFLIQDVEQKLKTLPGVAAVDAKIVFDPVWNPYTMMSDAAKLQLGLL